MPLVQKVIFSHCPGFEWIVENKDDSVAWSDECDYVPDTDYGYVKFINRSIEWFKRMQAINNLRESILKITVILLPHDAENHLQE